MPPLTYLDIDGDCVDPYAVHFKFCGWNHIWRMDDLRKLALLPNLRSASFCGTNLDDVGLEHVSHAATLEILDLQDTKISNCGLAHLARLPRLRSLRLNRNRQLTNQCVPHLLRLTSLTDLQIHETAIDQCGLANFEGMTSLRNICVDVRDNKYTFDGLLTLSARMTECTIRANGRGEFSQGQFHGQWGMTEPEWLTSTDPREMLEYMRGKAGDRKVRLFAVACCLRVWKSLKHDEFRKAVEAAEKFADGLVDQDALTRARQAALAVFADLRGNDNGPGAALSAAGLPVQPDSSTGEWWEDEFDRHDPLAPALLTSTHAARAAADEQGQSLVTERPAMFAEYRSQAAIIRCIFGNPFRPVSRLPSWLTSSVCALAGGIYEDRTFDCLPILADALEDAGCTVTELLAHCRIAGPHARGCWAVDLILGKE